VFNQKGDCPSRVQEAIDTWYAATHSFLFHALLVSLHCSSILLVTFRKQERKGVVGSTRRFPFHALLVTLSLFYTLEYVPRSQ